MKYFLLLSFAFFLHTVSLAQAAVNEGFINAGNFKIYYRQQGAGFSVTFLQLHK